jgi:vacuolar protein sorting-associated protein 54
MEITSSLTSELVGVLRHDLVERINGSSEEGGFKDRVRPLFHGLTRTKGVVTAMGEWREAVMDEVKLTIKQVGVVISFPMVWITYLLLCKAVTDS